METTTAEELQSKINTMKLTITFFTTKLENFISETNATDENLLKLLSNLTDSIQSFVLAARVIKTNHTIDSVVDKRILSCENIFECLACNAQTGKTYSSVVNHINSTKHIAQVKTFEKQLKQQPALKNVTAINQIPSTIPHFPLNREMNAAGMMPQYQPLPNAPFPLLPNHFNNFNQQSLMPPPMQQPMPIRPFSMAHGYNPMNPMQGNYNNNGPVNGRMNHFNQTFPPTNYKELFKMPLATNVVGFQQNVVNPSNEYRRILNHANDEPVQPPVAQAQRSRRRRRYGRKSRNSNHQSADMKLHPNGISFIRGNYENDVLEYIREGEKLSTDDLYSNITTNLMDCCREMNLTAVVKCFGSRIIGIGSTKSDIDLNVSVSDSNQTADTFLQQLLEVLLKNANWSNPIYIKSRVSLVRARHVSEKLDCDITFNNELAMANTKLIKYFYSIQPECQKLVVFMKMLIEKAQLYPQINTYTINLLVFFFLQVEGYLPKVVDLIETSSLKYWPNEFTQKSLTELNIKKLSKSFIELCIDFTNFYAHHVDFESNVLSTFTGTTILKSLFGTPEYQAISHCYDGLLQYMVDNTRAAECVRTNFKMAMCIQDPFSHDHNVSRCVGKLNLKRFKECCHDTCELLVFQLDAQDESS